MTDPRDAVVEAARMIAHNASALVDLWGVPALRQALAALDETPEQVGVEALNVVAAAGCLAARFRKHHDVLFSEPEAVRLLEAFTALTETPEQRVVRCARAYERRWYSGDKTPGHKYDGRTLDFLDAVRSLPEPTDG